MSSLEGKVDYHECGCAIMRRCSEHNLDALRAENEQIREWNAAIRAAAVEFVQSFESLGVEGVPGWSEVQRLKVLIR